MSKKILLVGHCGADTAYLKMAVKKAVGDAEIRGLDDPKSLMAALKTGDVSLILFNRELGYGFKTSEGVEMIRELQAEHADVKMMLITNYPEVQQAAQAAGAVPGFGKREIGSPRVTQLIRDAVGVEVAK